MFYEMRGRLRGKEAEVPSRRNDVAVGRGAGHGGLNYHHELALRASASVDGRATTATCLGEVHDVLPVGDLQEADTVSGPKGEARRRCLEVCRRSTSRPLDIPKANAGKCIGIEDGNEYVAANQWARAVYRRRVRAQESSRTAGDADGSGASGAAAGPAVH